MNLFLKELFKITRASTIYSRHDQPPVHSYVKETKVEIESRSHRSTRT